MCGNGDWFLQTRNKSSNFPDRVNPWPLTLAALAAHLSEHYWYSVLSGAHLHTTCYTLHTTLILTHNMLHITQNMDTYTQYATHYTEHWYLHTTCYTLHRTLILTHNMLHITQNIVINIIRYSDTHLHRTCYTLHRTLLKALYSDTMHIVQNIDIDAHYTEHWYKLHRTLMHIV